MLGIDTPYEAWCFDEACSEFGLTVEAEMAKARRGGKKSKLSEEQRAARAENALRKMLGEQPKFRDIAELIGKG